MQAAKDTFLMTLAARLAVVNPARTMTLDGASRPAVMAVENETAMPANTLLEAFLLHWGGAGHGEASPGESWGSLMYVDCKLSYASKGSAGMMGADRGRMVTAMDEELFRMSGPRWAACSDYTQTPPAALGTNIFWTQPVMAAPSEENGILARTATMRVFYFPEVS